MQAAFFSRHQIPTLHILTGRVADESLEKQTKVEIQNYAIGATSAEALLEIRFGKKVQDILGVRDQVNGNEVLTFTPKPRRPR